MNFQSFTEEQKLKFEQYLKSQITEKSGTQLEASMKYSLDAGGKRLRPLLLLAVLRAFEKEGSKGYPAAAALEMVHTYSLIHDDLPAMDNDSLRRGKATNHIQFNEATAILAGDALLTQAFEVIIEGDYSSNNKVALVRLLSECAGYQGMVGGQQADINAEQQKLTLNELENIHLRKTGALIHFAFVAAGILADQAPAILSLLKMIGYKLGIAYQIRDDILDVIGKEEETGKAVGADEKLGKSTYPSLLGLNKAQAQLIEALNAVKKMLKEIEKEVPVFDLELLSTFVDQLYLKELD